MSDKESGEVCPGSCGGVDVCWCSDDELWARLLGDKDPCAPGKDWVSAAFGDLDDDDEAAVRRAGGGA